MNIYVGNLPFSIRDEQLLAAFASYGTVKSAQVIVDKRSRRSRGYGFVEMADDAEAEKAIAALNGSELDGRTLRVDRSSEKSAAPSRSNRGRRRPARSGTEQKSANVNTATTRPQQSQGGVFGFFRKLFG
ncbi:MAG: RNA-binding protein [Gammaproteobacteria bacterium]|nr:RNA-binding protein [Gammaproteobacteria bacterium]